MPKSIFLIVLKVLGLISLTFALEWTKITNNGGTAPGARRDAALGYFQASNKLIVFGGRGSATFDDTWLFDLATGVWSDVSKTARPGARFSMVYGVVGTSFYITTGEGVNKVFYNDVWRFDLGPETWTQVSATGDIPKTRYGAAGGVYPGSTKLFVSLGFAKERYFDTLIFDTATSSWTTRFCDGHCNPYDPSYPHARCLHSAALVDSETLALFGGCLTGGKSGGACPSGDAWIFRDAEQKWSEVPGCPIPRTYSSMALLPEVNGVRRVVLYGGIEKTRQVIQTTPSSADSVAVLNPGIEEWTMRKTTASNGTFPAKRASAAMVTSTTGIYLFGGINTDTDATLNDIWHLVGNSSTADAATKEDCPSLFSNYLLVHGIFMYLAWGVCMIWGTFIARYFNSSGKKWFILHRIYQISGLVLSILGLIMGILSVQFDHFKFGHGAIGLIIMILALSQPFNALIRPDRPKEGEEKPLRRRVWEIFHHNIGRLAVILGLINISLGIFLANAHVFIVGYWYFYLFVIVITFVVFELLRIKVVREKIRKILPLDTDQSSKDNGQELKDIEKPERNGKSVPAKDGSSSDVLSEKNGRIESTQEN